LEKNEALEEAIWAGIYANRAHYEVAREMPGVMEAKREQFKREAYRKDSDTSH
jgi:hypothetical protein